MGPKERKKGKEGQEALLTWALGPSYPRLLDTGAHALLTRPIKLRVSYPTAQPQFPIRFSPLPTLL